MSRIPTVHVQNTTTRPWQFTCWRNSSGQVNHKKSSFRRRLIKVRNKHPLKQVRLKWDLSFNQEYFDLTRNNTRKIQTKKGIRLTSTTRHGTYNSKLNLESFQHTLNGSKEDRWEGAAGEKDEGIKRRRINSDRISRVDVESVVRVGIG